MFRRLSETARNEYVVPAGFLPECYPFENKQFLFMSLGWGYKLGYTEAGAGPTLATC